MIHSSKNKRLWYLSGGMTKFGIEDFDQSNEWRETVKKKIEDASNGDVCCFNPNDHWNFKTDTSTFEDREAMNLDIYKLRKSELVIYNNNDPYSRGSMIELGIAIERNLPIITLNEQSQELHPWVRDYSQCIFAEVDKMVAYLTDHYIKVD